MSQEKEFEITSVLNASPEAVWKAITDKKQMKQWYFDLAEFKPEKGFEFRFTGGSPDGKQYLHICKIVEAIPGKKLSYSWRYDGYGGDSLVTFELSEEKGKTKLKLTHKGLETFPANNPDFARHNFEAGWTQIIGTSLPSFLENNSTGKTPAREVTITRILNAPRKLVWDVWTNEEHVKNWWGPRGFTAPLCDWKGKPRDKILVHMKGPDGVTYPMGGEFIEAKEPERLVFITRALDQDGKTVLEATNTITLTEQGNKTKLTVKAVVTKITPEATTYLAGMNEGWKQSIDKFEEYIATI